MLRNNSDMPKTL